MAMLLLWILSLAASSLLPAMGETVINFKSCKQFFLDGKPPLLMPKNPARICQSYYDQYRFATMYDKDLRIPMFSAYKYKAGHGVEPIAWKIEPQLAHPGDRRRRNMESEEDSGLNQHQLKNSQAVSEDYAETFNYTLGQLTPFSHQPDQDSKTATYTLTNVVPQLTVLAEGEWADYLRQMSTDANGCDDTYVIAGAVPGDTFLGTQRVNIPSFIWAAVCCVRPNGQKDSWGVIADNSQNYLERFSLRTLEEQLKDKYRKPVNLFSSACY